MNRYHAHKPQEDLAQRNIIIKTVSDSEDNKI